MTSITLFKLFYDFLSLVVVCIAHGDWEPRGGHRVVSVASYTQFLGTFQTFMMSQAKGEKRKRNESFCSSIALTLEHI